MSLNNVHRRLRGSLWAAFVLIVCLLACQTTPTDSLHTPITEITFVAATANWSRYIALAETFNTHYPHIRVRVLDPQTITPAADPTMTMEAQALALLEKADVILSAELDPTVFNAQTGVLYDLAPLLTQEDTRALHEFYPGLVERLRENGQIWGLPLGVSPYVVYYVPAYFDAIQEPYPAHDWTWPDLIEKAQRLAAAHDNLWGVTELDPYTSCGPLLLHYGAVLVEEGQPGFDTPLNATALAQYIHLITQDLFMPSDVTAAGTIQAAMWLQPLGIRWASTQRFRDVRLAPLPQDAHPVAMEVVSAGYVNGATASPQAAWLWLDFLSRQPPPSGDLPVRRSTFDSAVYRATVDAATYAVYAHILENLPENPWPGRYGWFREAYRWLAQKGIPLLIQGAQPADVLQQAQTYAQQKFAQNALTPDVALLQPTAATPSPTDRKVISCLVPADPHNYEAAAQHYIESLNEPLHIVIRSYLSGVHYPPAKRAAEADVFAAPSDFRRAAVQPYWLNLQPFIENDDTLNLDDFYPQALERYRREGELWGLPVAMDTSLLFYNVALFDAAGLPYPTEDWTWDILVETAQRLSFGEGATRQWGFATVTEYWATLPLIRAAQQTGRAAPLVDHPTAPARPTLDAPVVIDSVRWYATISQDSHVMLPPALYVRDWSIPLDLIYKGQVALWISTIGVLGESLPIDVGVAPLPVSGTPYTTYSVSGYALSAQSQHYQAAWQWLLHLTRQPDLARAAPARRSLLDQAVFPMYPESARAPLRQAFRATLETYADSAFDDVQADTGWYDVAYRLYRLAVRETLEKGADPAHTLGRAQQIAEAYLACLEANSNRETPETGQQCEIEAGVPPAKVWYED